MSRGCTSSIELDRASVRAVQASLEEVETRVNKGLLMISKILAEKVSEWAKREARWTDRTGNARQLLHGKAYNENVYTVVIAICHGVEYGKWLELAHEKRYAILAESLEKNKEMIFREWRKVVDLS